MIQSRQPEVLWKQRTFCCSTCQTALFNGDPNPLLISPPNMPLHHWFARPLSFVGQCSAFAPDRREQQKPRIKSRTLFAPASPHLSTTPCIQFQICYTIHKRFIGARQKERKKPIIRCAAAQISRFYICGATAKEEKWRQILHKITESRAGSFG